MRGDSKEAIHMRILVIEDHPGYAEALRTGLTANGYAVDATAEGREGEAMAATTPYDLIVLDLMLPDCDGLNVCRNLRRRKVATPIVIVSDLAGTEHKIEGLNAGADDYVGKPVEFEEFLARARALMRRRESTEAAVLRFDDLELDLLKRSVSFAGDRVRLSAREMSLLETFMRNPDRMLSRTAIGEKVWDMNFAPGSNVIDVHVSSLRRKLGGAGAPPFIHTVVGMGYRFGSPDPEACRAVGTKLLANARKAPARGL